MTVNIKNLIAKLKIVRVCLCYSHALRDYSYDAFRFIAHSGWKNKKPNKSKDAAALRKNYHVIEKGLSLPAPRPGFGRDLIMQVIAQLDAYKCAYGYDDVSICAIKTLVDYKEFNVSKSKSDDHLNHKIDSLWREVEQSDCESAGGRLELSREWIVSNSREGFEELLRTRYSIRNFTSETVSNKSLRAAVRMAQESPSVCNRQSVRVYSYSDKEKISEILKLQNGNRGFTEVIGSLLIVTSQLDHFFESGERNQCWIDGGLFAMTLLLALHAHGLGACALNWSVRHDIDKRLREVASIAEEDAVIFLIAVGHIPDVLNVPVSARRPLDEVFIQH